MDTAVSFGGTLMITERAYAKINLSLDVTGRRPDGYHEVRMIMQNVDIYDTLVFEKKDEGISMDVGESDLPADEDNLIYKAAKAVMEKCEITDGVKISLDKHIPIAAGMAGGSSDAAAALRGVNRLFECGLTYDELRELGVKIGADVPYCVLGGTALSVETSGDPQGLFDRLSEKTILVGGVQPVRCLLQGTPDEVRASARRYAEMGYPVIIPECGVPPMTPDENLYALAHYRD